MAVTINQLSRPTNVQATLQSGGSLLASTTYYVKVVARNFTDHLIRENEIISPPSVEISFTTDSTNKSALISWDAVSGASRYTIYLTKVSGNYLAKAKSDFISTTSYLISTETTGYEFDLIGYNRTIPSLFTNRDIGIPVINISGSETLQSVYNQIKAILPDNVFYDPSQYFFFAGGIYITSGTTGSLTISGITFYLLFGTIRNLSSSFTLQFGIITNGITADGCNISLMGYVNYLNGIYFYGNKFLAKYDVMPYLFIGAEWFFDLDKAVGNEFFSVRQTNTNYSYQKVTNFTAICRTWNNTDIYESYYNCNIPLTYYPRNGAQTFYRGTFDFSNNSQSYCIRMDGYQGINYPPSKFYDCKFIGTKFNSYNALVFSFRAYSGCQGFEFYNSITTYVKDKAGNPISGVNVKCYNKNNQLIFDKNTDSDGLQSLEYLLIMKIVPTGDGDGDAYYTKEFFYPYKLVYSKSGYQSITTYISPEVATSLSLVMLIEKLIISSLSFTHPTQSNNGTITVQASGGVAPYQYSIDDGATWQASGEFTGLAAGDYIVKVKDNEGIEVDGVTVTLKKTDYIDLENLEFNLETNSLEFEIEPEPSLTFELY